MSPPGRILLLSALLWVPRAPGQATGREPHIGYAYPAGARQNSTVRVTIGGQNLRGVTQVHLTGTGVRGRVLQFYPPLRNITPEQRDALAGRFRELMAQRWAELAAAGRVGPLPPRLRDLDRRGGAQTQPASAPAELPPHPLLYDLEHRSLRELLHIRQMLALLRQVPPSGQLAESVLIELTAEKEAAPGDRELRLIGPVGLTNPLRFQVGGWPEKCELEEGDARLAELLPAEPPAELPVVFNGQILPGDVDRFRFHARAGQGLVIAAHARRLIPYLADAVPGWFQATVAVYDAAGAEVAFADDYRFDPDPVLFYEVLADGEYQVEIRDSIYRGRQDFVYRISVGEQPFITSLFPLGTGSGHKRYVQIAGWNLNTERLILDPGSERDGLRQVCLGVGKHASNRVTYDIETLPAEPETEPNDASENAQRVAPPRIIDGRIGTPGDVDLFRFNSRAGSEVVAEIVARRVNSPVDSILRLLDADGRVLAWNDDYEHKDGFLHVDTGLHTHGADSYLRAALPADGTYYVQVSDAQGQGGAENGYRLRVGPPRPDFALRVTPSSVNVGPGGAALLCVYALREDGFDGAIELALEELADGFRLDGATVPAGRDRVRMTLTALRKVGEQPVALRLTGRARIGDQTISRPAAPADDVMQAFLYRHLTPAEELLVAVRGAQAGADIAIVSPVPARIPAAGTASVRVRVPRRLLERGLELQLNEPPAGIALAKVESAEGGLLLTLRADATAVPGTADNLIVETFAEVGRQRKGAEASRPTARASAGFLPAIPIVVTKP